MGAPIKKERVIGPAPEVEVRKADGTSAGTINLDPQVFALAPNVPLMHQVVNAQLAAARSGTQSTKTRAEVQGGGAKPWRQKGTGRARAGSVRSPIFSGGGVALGPKPRKYNQKTPRKMIQQALRCALSDRASDGRIIVLDSVSIDTPKTKEAIALLNGLGATTNVLAVLGAEDENLYLSLRNLPWVHVVPATELNVFDVLRSDYVIFTRETLPGEQPEATAVDAPKRKSSKPAAGKSANEASPAVAAATAPATEQPVAAAGEVNTQDPVEGATDAVPSTPASEEEEK